MNLSFELSSILKDDKRLYNINIDYEGNKFSLIKTKDEFEYLLSSLKKINPVNYGHFKVPGKKFLKDVTKQRVAVFSDVLATVSKDKETLETDIIQQFFDLEKYIVDSTSDSGDLGNTFNLGEFNNNKAKPSDFDFLKVIGKGSFGQVYLARHKTENVHYAVKVLLKKQILKRNEIKHIMAERSVLLRNDRHPFLVSLHYSFQTKDKLYFVLTYVNGGELFYHLQREKFFPEARVLFYSAELALAINHLHTINIIYRDLKPENILLDKEGHVVLTDFGLSKEFNSSNIKTDTFCGTPEYLAPEVLKKKSYGKAVDWWCLGCVIYELMFGLPPFYNKDSSIMFENILYSALNIPRNVSAEAQLILKEFLQKDPSKRLGNTEGGFANIKSHPFYADIDWDALYARKVTPPYNPNVRSDHDIKNIDTEFTSEPVPESMLPGGRQMQTYNQNENSDFLGFTYTQENEDLGA